MSPSGRKHKLYDITGEYGNRNYILIAVDFKIVAYIDNCCQQYLGENLASCRLEVCLLKRRNAQVSRPARSGLRGPLFQKKVFERQV